MNLPTSTERAIRLAQKSGWVDSRDLLMGDNMVVLIDERAFLDKDFWVALGKSLGWPQDDWKGPFYIYQQEGWLGRWHSFIDALSQGKTAEDFFSSLLSTNMNEI